MPSDFDIVDILSLHLEIIKICQSEHILIVFVIYYIPFAISYAPAMAVRMLPIPVQSPVS